MTTPITRQQLTDCIEPTEMEGPLSRQDGLLALICMNDILAVTPALRKQLETLFGAKPRTWRNIETLIGEA